MSVSGTIGDLGEFGLIARITEAFPQTSDVILGPGDDAAVVGAPDGRTVATTDLLVEGVHFRRDWSSAHDVGHKAAAQNIADVAAMGARPTALLLGLAAPPELPLAWLDGFTAGLRAECARAGTAVAGGDIVRAPAVTLAITALGDLGGRAPVRRDGARAGDVVALAGQLGLSAAGLALLRAGLDGPGACLDAHRRPAPPYPAGPRAADLGATAMIDVSDGLLQDLAHVGAASGVAIEVHRHRLRPAPELEVAGEILSAAGAGNGDPVSLMLSGGEDHALAATFPPATPLPPEWSVIGEVVPGSGVTVDGQRPQTSGWEHFSA